MTPLSRSHWSASASDVMLLPSSVNVAVLSSMSEEDISLADDMGRVALR